LAFLVDHCRTIAVAPRRAVVPTVDRRRFLQLAGASATLTALSTSVARAATIPASRTHGSLDDIEHVVVLMQENRSFDHYFGTLQGVRGFGDPHPAVLPSGKSVWHQSDGTREVLPFRPDVHDLGLAFIQDLDHSWNGGHAAFDNGRYDGWIAAKSATTMAHLGRSDIPFHYALADAFTICDSYHCSLLGPTDPNRYYMWTGWVGNDGRGGGPVIANDELGYSWTTYPERLQAAGVSWKIYQDAGTGLDAAGSWGWTDNAYIGNYGDNSLLYFDQYRNAAPGSPLYERARTGTSAVSGQSYFDVLRSDVQAGRLPQVSWIAAPEAFTEHPNWPANYGAWYVSQVLDALTSDPDVWSRTALLITYDENDGFFDHVVPPYPSGAGRPGASTVSTVNETYAGPEGVPANFGLGQRVPMLVVSPWSTGGYVCSETFDHTSIIRLMEQRFGVREPNITPWRRTVCGDLTSAFDFGRDRARRPHLPSTAAYKPADDQRHPDYVPVPPADPQLPRQEKGARPSRALAYRLRADATVTAAELRVAIANEGRLGAQLQARTEPLLVPATYTVGAGHELTAAFPIVGAYDVRLHGPNGFFRRFAGPAGHQAVEVTATPASHRRRLTLVIANTSGGIRTVEVVDAYRRRRRTLTVAPGRRQHFDLDAADTGGWYDLTITVHGVAGFVRELAGRVEDGRDGTTDPQLGR
jgi:phospholipase C